MTENKMKAAIFYGAHDIRIEELDVPTISEEEVLIKIKAAGICGSDLHRYVSGQREPCGVMFGHEFSGEVVEVGKNVSGLSVGDRVAVEPLVSCGKCLQCLSGRYNLCSQLNWIPGFAEFACAPWNKVYKIPDHITYEEAALLDCIAVGVHAVKLSGLKIGETAAIFGSGTIGLSTMQVAKASGAIVYSLGTHDFQLKLAKDLGADITINVRKENLLEKMMDLTGREYLNFLRKELPKGTDYVFEAVGGQKSPLQDAIKIVRRGGTIVSIGSPQNLINLSEIVFKEVRIIGSWSYTYYNYKPEFQIALDLLSEGKVNAKKMITQTYPLEKIDEGFRVALNKAQTPSIKVIIKP